MSTIYTSIYLYIYKSDDWSCLIQSIFFSAISKKWFEKYMLFICMDVYYIIIVYRLDNNNNGSLWECGCVCVCFDHFCHCQFNLFTVLTRDFKGPIRIRMKLNLTHIRWNWLNALSSNGLMQLKMSLLEMMADVGVMCSNRSSDDVWHVCCMWEHTNENPNHWKRRYRIVVDGNIQKSI